MLCPRCGSVQSEELKFCKVCGANMAAVMQVVDVREPEQKFDWSKTWVAEMFMSAEEQKRRKAELERQSGITPEIKRYQEIKAGVIVSSVGIALAIFLFVFMQGLIASGEVTPEAAEILSRLWIAGVIPLFVGLFADNQRRGSQQEDRGSDATGGADGTRAFGRSGEPPVASACRHQ